jgi:(R)-2-hydroxyacyl-CoA dehydratese activating ATPase
MIKSLSKNHHSHIVFTGGVANNPCMRTLLEENLGRRIIIPEDPQSIGARGAALMAAELP